MGVIAVAVRELIALGVTGDALVAAIERMEEANSGEAVTARQARNRRYYEKKREERERLKASENRLKASESEASETRLKTSESVLNQDATRARREVITSNSVDTCYHTTPLEAHEWPAKPIEAILAEVISPHLDRSKSPGLTTTAGEFGVWRRAGASWEHDVLPVIAGKVQAARRPITTWRYFTDAILETAAANRRAMTLPEARNDYHDRNATRSDLRRAATDARRAGWVDAVAEWNGADLGGDGDGAGCGASDQDRAGRLLIAHSG